ncbi:MAG: glycosyltransferase family 4 protein [Bacteroidetes bacterium]|nr:glycosyltransferase family 4 protein [Bacteroidota bacterium]
MKRLAIITSHPIQYNAPLFKLLAERNRIELKVFYTWSQSQSGKLYDPGFAQSREWDIPLLEGYDFDFVENTAKDPGSHHFRGIINPDLIQRIKIYNPDAILIYGWSFHSHLKALRHFKGKIPVLFRGDSTLLNETSKLSFKKILRRIFLRWVYRSVDKVFYVGLSNKQYFLSNGLHTDQLIFAPHAIDNERFFLNNEYYEKEASLWRKQLNIPENSMVFLFAGKLEPKKNPLLLLDAFQSISDASIRLVLVGNGILERDIKDKAKNDPRIIFLDFQNQSRMPIVYRLGDVFILPSRGPGETWGLSVNEVLACGRSAILSDKCGCAVDLNIANNSVFTSGDKNMLVGVMNKYINQGRNDLQKMTSSIQQQIQPWSLENVASAIEETVHSL